MVYIWVFLLCVGQGFRRAVLEPGFLQAASSVEEMNMFCFVFFNYEYRLKSLMRFLKEICYCVTLQEGYKMPEIL